MKKGNHGGLAWIKLLQPAEVAEILGVSVNTLAHWRARGKGPPWVKIGGLRYPGNDLQNWIQTRLRLEDIDRQGKRPTE